MGGNAFWATAPVSSCLHGHEIGIQRLEQNQPALADTQAGQFAISQQASQVLAVVPRELGRTQHGYIFF